MEHAIFLGVWNTTVQWNEHINQISTTVSKYWYLKENKSLVDNRYALVADIGLSVVRMSSVVRSVLISQNLEN